MKTCIQINLQKSFGGGEVYTAAFIRALSGLGIASRLYAHSESGAWDQLALPEGTRITALADADELPRQLAGSSPAWIVCHTLLPARTVAALQNSGHYVTAFAHMPLFERSPEPLRPYDLIFPVSAYVRATLLAGGLEQAYAEPLYGIAYLERGGASSGPTSIQRTSRYDWDRRKVRERLLGCVEPLWEALRPARAFSRLPGVTLGIVSRLTTIKQFPLLFSILVPVLARFPDVNLEIFGAGGYASVRDLRKALAPIRSRVRFWGHQRDVVSIYEQLDALLTGLPEKEALGLNVIEAQFFGVPILAPDAAPFDETVVHGITGLRYGDPRRDRGKSFGESLERLRAGGFHVDREAARAHLERFSVAAFSARCGRLVAAIEATTEGRCQ